MKTSISIIRTAENTLVVACASVNPNAAWNERRKKVDKYVEIENSALGRDVIASGIGCFINSFRDVVSVSIVDQFLWSDTIEFDATKYSKDALAVAVGKQVKKI